MKNLKQPVSTVLLVATFVSTLVLTGCDTKSSDYNFNTTATPTDVAKAPHGPVFDPAKGKIPTTNDLLFKDSKDGTLNIPNDADKDGKPDNPIIAQINQLDGFSTTNPITIDFGMDIDPASLGDGVKVFQVLKDPKTGLVTSVVRELSNAEIVAVPTADKKLAIIPKRPLTEGSSYLVVLTNAIKDSKGKKAETPAPYFLAKGSAPLTGGNYEALEPLRALINNMETKVVEFDDKVKKDDIIMSWSFTTQSISAVLNAMLASIDVKNDDISMGTTSVGDSPLGAADIFLGTLKVPYYLEVPSTNNPTAPLTGYWKGKGGSALTRYNTSPVKNSTLTIPVIMTVPKGATNPPVVIYQHGITRMRTDVLAYADAMAQAGRAVIAIDLPLHGTPTDNLLHTPIEPTFDMDFLNNETGAPGPDGKIDTSGAHFMNLASLLTSRDNIRQGVSNLLVLRRSLKNIANIDATKVGFVAHSLGGIVAVPYLAIEDKPTPSSLIAAGAGIRNMLLESDPFGLQIKAGLKANGIEGEKYDAFMYATQFILESADPINYAADAAQTHPVHLIEIIGDKVVVNKTTEALAGLMQAKAVSTTATDISAGKPGIVRFTQGNHSSVLDPTRGGNFLNVFTEIHTQLATFQASSGTTIKITDDSIIKQ
jgi:dienelactone hydrolase